MSDIRHTAVLGAGLIGASWAALFLASGRSVAVFDPASDSEARVRRVIDTAWPTLEALGMTERRSSQDISFHTSAAEAVRGAGFIQENVPERLPIKHATFADIEPALNPDAIVASSASGLTLAQMQDGWQNPARFILGHPFNPPHLIPLVELMGNEKTDGDVLPKAEAFYADIGKVTIRLNKGLPGHVANRLQAAVWREAIHLVVSGVASVEDVDKAMWAGPGRRWAAMGPTTLFHLGAGDAGLEGFCDHFRDTFHGWWEDLGEVQLTDYVIAKLSQGIKDAVGEKSTKALTAERDARILAIDTALRSARPD